VARRFPHYNEEKICMATVVLPDTVRTLYPFKSSFITLSDGKRMHYVSEGPEDGEVLFFLHGYPTWSFIYRAPLVYYGALGYRCIAVDLMGYGLSDKPTNKRYHTLRQHIQNLFEFLTLLDLHDITLIMEDWGGPMGLSYAIQRRENIKRVVIMNSWVFQDSYLNRLDSLVNWVTKPGIGELLFGTFNLAFNLVVQRWTARLLSETVLSAYKAPFRDARHRAALIQFPRMINTTPEHPSAEIMREIEQNLSTLRHTPTLLLWGKDDPVFPPGVAAHWKSMMPRAKGPFMIEPARHLLAEDAPDEVIQYLNRFLDTT
jgi:pimeloyl-ACP methyl ester carboxylesterase